MIRLYLKLSLPIALIFLTVSLVARALGTTQPPNPALRGFTEGCEDKPQPCWYGIVPGVTTAEEAIKMLNEIGYSVNGGLVIGYSEIEAVRPSDNCDLKLIFFMPEIDRKVGGIQVIGCKELRLGELMAEVQKPQGFSICGGTHHHWLTFYYKSGEVLDIYTKPNYRAIEISDYISQFFAVGSFKISVLDPNHFRYLENGWIIASPMWQYYRRSEFSC